MKTKLKNSDSNEINTNPVHQETTANTASVTPIGLTLEWQKYSSYEKLLRIVAFILRISPKFSGNRTKTGAITNPVELESAEQKLFFLVQSEVFPNETKNCSSCSLSKPSVRKDFSPFIGPNGLLRAQGQTKHLEFVNFDVKHPILLDTRHPAVRLFLEHLHEKHCHQGVEYLRALIQQKFAIVKLRTTLRTIQTRCVTCRKRKAETLTPIMAHLPKERLRLAFTSRPFTNTDLDYFGPFYVSVNAPQRSGGDFSSHVLQLALSISKLCHHWTPAVASWELRDLFLVESSLLLSCQTMGLISLSQKKNSPRTFSSGINSQLLSLW